MISQKQASREQNLPCLKTDKHAGNPILETKDMGGGGGKKGRDIKNGKNCFRKVMKREKQR